MNSIGDLIGPAMTYLTTSIIWGIEMAIDQKKLFKKERYPLGHQTQCRTISEYFELYSGPEYLIESKQAILLNIVMTCFLFGPGIPILFIFALFSLSFMYIFEYRTLAR